MASGSSSALVRRSTDTELMPPPAVKRIKRPQKILDEDTYTSAISEIIARDFFPGLVESEVQQEYLDALDSKDKVWISSASRRLHQVMTPGQRRGRRGTSIRTPLPVGSETPRGYGGDTPASVASDLTSVSTQAAAGEEVDTNMSLSNFQARYTSEDNESFYKLLDKQNQQRAERYAWMWRGNKLPSKQMLKQKEVETKLLESGRSLEDNGGTRDRLAISACGEKPAMAESWKYKANNNFMFVAESVEDSVETVAQKAQAESRAAPKSVLYANTRMPLPDTKAPEVPASPSLSAIHDAIAGRPRRTDSVPGYNGNETPRVNGYAFVDDEPEDEYVPPSVPIELGKGESTPNPFRIKEQSAREDLHHRMVDRVAKNKRASLHLGMTGKLNGTPVPKFPSSPRVNVGELTPAAQRLWSRVGRFSRRDSPGTSGVRTPLMAKTRGFGLKFGLTPK